MRQPIAEVVGGWWRFDRYEVRERYVRPHAGAKLARYDPWQAYLQSRMGRRVPAPYQSVLLLLSELGLSENDMLSRKPAPPSGAPRNWRTLIERWCAVNGLFGSLLHRVHLVVLAPRWAEEQGVVTVGLGSEKLLVPRQERHLRTNCPWSPFLTSEEFASLQWSRDASAAGTLVPTEDRPKNWPGPSVALRDLERPGWTLEPLLTTWGRFFPDVPVDERETYAYPAPLTDEFWHAYAEPLDEFLGSATKLAKVIYQLGAAQPTKNQKLEQTADGRSPLLDGVATLHALIAPVSPALADSGDGTLRVRWIAPSLLGLFAMMVLEDLAEGRTVRRCANCATPFASRSPGARHCSTRCEATYNQRMWRDREREKKRKELVLEMKKKRKARAGTVTKQGGRRTKLLHARRR